jgi:hypothetical protein
MTRRLPDETTRRLVARTGGYGRVLAAESPAAVSAPARAAFLRRIEREVDPDSSLPAEVRAAKVRAALAQQMQRVSLARVRKAKARREAAPVAPAEPVLQAVRPPVPATWEEFLARRGLVGGSE